MSESEVKAWAGFSSRRIATFVQATASTALVVFAILYVLHWRYVRSLPADYCPAPEVYSRGSGVPIDLARSIGFSDPVDLPLMVNLATRSRRHQGIIRIAALGDSATFGSEVVRGLDYPALLQKRFAAAGMNNVEVLNLGVPWRGLGETLRYYEEFAKDYAFDFVLLGPETLYIERDVTFNHTDDRVPCYNHGRYILHGEDVKYVDLDCESIDECEDGYYSFFPSWRYLRYDRRAPAFIRAIMPSGKSLENPFYYESSSPDLERDQLYPRLLRRFAKDGQAVVLLQTRRPLVDMAQRVADRIASCHIAPYRFPYRRPVGHLSGNGNALLAKGYFDLLTGSAAITLDVFSFIDPGATKFVASPQTFDGFRSGHLWLADTPIADLIYVPKDHDMLTPTQLVRFAEDGIRSLLALREPDVPFAGSYFVPLPFPLQPGMVVELETDGDAPSSLQSTPLAQVSREVSIGEARLPGVFAFEDGRTGLYILPDRVPGLRSGRLTVGGKPVCTLRRNDFGDIVVESTYRRLITARPRADALFDETKLPPRGRTKLVLDQGQKALDVDLGGFERQAEQTACRSAGLKRIIAPSKAQPSTAEIVAR